MHYNAVVLGVRDLAPDVRAIRLRVSGSPIRYEAGGHVDVEVQIAGSVQLRSYSMVGFGQRQEVTIAVKLAPRSRGGSAYMWSLSEGSRVTLRAARNALPVSYNADRYVLIAGGIGITPITSVAQALVEGGKKAVLHYCVRDAGSAPFVAELSNLLAENLVIHPSSLGLMLDVAALIERLDPTTVCYMCGPLRLMEAVIKTWQRCRLPRENLRFETFGSSGQLPAAGFEVVLRETGARVFVPESVSMLDSLLQAGHDVMYGCRRGECGLCKIEIDAVIGSIDHRDVFLSDYERSSNRAMCCCVSRVLGGSVTVRIDGISHGRGT